MFKKVSLGLIIFIKVIKFLFLKRLIGFEKLISKLPERKGKTYSKEFIFLYCNYFLKAFGIDNCFTKSLVIREILIQNYFEANIEIGLQKNRSKTISHCWVVSGNLYNEASNIRKGFKVLEIK